MHPSSDVVDSQQSALQQCIVLGGSGVNTLAGDPSTLFYGASSSSDREYEPLGVHGSPPVPREFVTYNNSNWEALHANLRKVRKRWGLVVKVQRQKGCM